MELTLNEAQMSTVVRMNRWVGRLQGICFCLAVFIAWAWLAQMTVN